MKEGLRQGHKALYNPNTELICNEKILLPIYLLNNLQSQNTETLSISALHSLPSYILPLFLLVFFDFSSTQLFFFTLSSIKQKNSAYKISFHINFTGSLNINIKHNLQLEGSGALFSQKTLFWFLSALWARFAGLPMTLSFLPGVCELSPLLPQLPCHQSSFPLF